MIITDAPPVLAFADALQLAACAGATIFVVEAGGAHYGQAKAAVRRLYSGHANIIGGIVTKYNAKASNYGDLSDYYNYSYADGN